MSSLGADGTRGTLPCDATHQPPGGTAELANHTSRKPLSRETRLVGGQRSGTTDKRTSSGSPSKQVVDAAEARGARDEREEQHNLIRARGGREGRKAANNQGEREQMLRVGGGRAAQSLSAASWSLSHSALSANDLCWASMRRYGMSKYFNSSQNPEERSINTQGRSNPEPPLRLTWPWEEATHQNVILFENCVILGCRKTPTTWPWHWLAENTFYQRRKSLW